MLVIKAEIWPQGDVDSRFEIARLGIINRGGDSIIGDYNVIGLLERDRTEFVRADVLLAHDRRNGWRPLTSRALHACGSPGLFHPEYVQTVVELLKRG